MFIANVISIEWDENNECFKGTTENNPSIEEWGDSQEEVLELVLSHLETLEEMEGL